MLHCRTTLNNKINHINERALRTASLIKMAPLRFIKKNSEFSAIEIYRYLHGLSPTILGEVIKVKEAVCQKFKRYGTETTSLLPPNIWALIPQNIKDSSSLSSFRNALENGNPTAHIVYANHFCSMFVLPNSTAVLPSLLLIYVKFKLPVHVHIANCL